MPKLIKHSTKGLTEQQWQDLRRSFSSKGMVGGSDASTLLGYNEYKSRTELFYEALGLLTRAVKLNVPMMMGSQLESVVLHNWRHYDGTDDGWVSNIINKTPIKKATKVKAVIINPKYPFLFANVDSKCVLHPVYGKKPGIVEAKTINGYAADKYEWGFPPGYLIQLQDYLLVTGYSWGEIAVMKDGRNMNVVTFEADKELQQRIAHEAELHYVRVAAARESLDKNKLAPVEEKLQLASLHEPEPDSSQAYNEFVTDRHKNKPNPNAIRGNMEHQLWAEKFIEYKEKEQEMLIEKTAYQNKLKNFMDINSANELLLPEGKIKWNKMFIVTI